MTSSAIGVSLSSPTCGKIQAELTDASEQEIALLKNMEAWSVRYENSPDAKAKELIAYLKAVCLPGGRHWTSERVVVFTEYRDTQIWLKDLLAQEGMAGEQVRLLSGGMEIGPWPGPRGYCHLHGIRAAPMLTLCWLLFLSAATIRDGREDEQQAASA